MTQMHQTCKPTAALPHKRCSCQQASRRMGAGWGPAFPGPKASRQHAVRRAGRIIAG